VSNKNHSVWTSSGLFVDLLDPLPEQISLDDIAWGLAHTNRYNGQGGVYSVAEHCVHASNLAPAGYELAALLHDAAEAYTGDWVRPLRGALNGPSYTKLLEIQRGIEYTICSALYGGPPAAARSQFESSVIIEIDDRLLATECLQLFGGDAYKSCGIQARPYEHLRLHRWAPRRAYREYRNRYEAITQRAGTAGGAGGGLC